MTARSARGTRLHARHHTGVVLVALFALVAVVAAGCSDGGGTSKHSSASTTAVVRVKGARSVRVSNLDRCDPLAARGCLYPFPNDYFTVADRSTATGLHVHFDRASMPVNAQGVAIDPTEWNRNDGFSPGSPVIMFVPGLDLAKTGAAPITDIGRSLARDAPIVLLDATTGKRHPYFAELDESGRRDGDPSPALVVRPAVNYAEGHRFVVALRRLEDQTGATIPAGDAFTAYRDRLGTQNPALERRRPHMERLFATLADAGVPRGDLYLAWDFTVASERNLTERILHIRDDALAALGNGVPNFTVAPTTTDTASPANVVEGTFEVPLYLNDGGVPGSTFEYGSDGLPRRTGTFTAKFDCVVPQASSSSKPVQGIVYGHGLLGARDEVLGFGQYAVQHHAVLCATDWIGLAEEDTPTAITVLQDGSNMPKIADRLQQSILNTLFLARLTKHPKGLASNPAFQRADGSPILATGDVVFWGRSQGGIMGGSATAVSTEWTRAVLGEAAANYSTLLNRSKDFDEYAVVQRASYARLDDRPLLHPLMSMLWDRGEADGYVAHLTDHPLPGTPKHTVMIFEAFGDHQVPNVATEVEARTAGLKLREPALAAGRSPDRAPFWGIGRVQRMPHDGSVLIVWDFGTPRPPLANLPPHDGEYGLDPHDMDAVTPSAMDMVERFLAKGTLVDVCDAKPCNETPGTAG